MFVFEDTLLRVAKGKPRMGDSPDPTEVDPRSTGQPTASRRGTLSLADSSADLPERWCPF